MTAPEDINATFQQASSDLDSSELRIARAEARISKARSPIGRFFGRIGLRAAQADAYDSAEHYDFASELRHRLEQDGLEASLDD